MGKLHSAYGFDLMKDGNSSLELYGDGCKLIKLVDRELLSVDNGDSYIIDDDVAYFVSHKRKIDVLHCTREMNELGINFIFNKG